MVSMIINFSCTSFLSLLNKPSAGYGHATRSIELIRYLLEFNNNYEYEVHIVTPIDKSFFIEALDITEIKNSEDRFFVHDRTLDSGAFQTTPLSISLEKTLKAYYSNIYLQRDLLVDKEVLLVGQRILNLRILVFLIVLPYI